jgi:LEA14-like dessication related protein
MDGLGKWKTLGAGAVASLLLGCASTGHLVDAPSVRLSNVEVTKIDLDDQTFLLDFEVSNPNPFPLPVRSISYGVELDGFRFASGETQGNFTVPAGGDGKFAISVDVDLMRTAPQLLFIVRDGVRRDIPYELNGRFEVDIPLAPALSFRNDGRIRLQATEIAAKRRH